MHLTATSIPSVRAKTIVATGKKKIFAEETRRWSQKWSQFCSDGCVQAVSMSSIPIDLPGAASASWHQHSPRRAELGPAAQDEL